MEYRDITEDLQNSGRSLEFLANKYNTTVDNVKDVIDEMIAGGYAIMQSGEYYAIITYKFPDPMKIGPLLTKYPTRFSYGIWTPDDVWMAFPEYIKEKFNASVIFCMGLSSDGWLPEVDGVVYYILYDKQDWNKSALVNGIDGLKKICDSRDDFVYLGYSTCEVLITDKYSITLNMGQQDSGGTIYEIDVNKDGNVVGMKSKFVP